MTQHIAHPLIGLHVRLVSRSPSREREPRTGSGSRMRKKVTPMAVTLITVGPNCCRAPAREALDRRLPLVLLERPAGADQQDGYLLRKQMLVIVVPTLSELRPVTPAYPLASYINLTLM